MPGLGLFTALIVSFALANDFLEIPNGYRQGRAEIHRAAFDNDLSSAAHPFQDQAELLKRKVYGLASDGFTMSLNSSKKLLELEVSILQLYMKVTNSPLTKVEGNILREELSRTYQLLRFSNELLFEDTIRWLDLVFPGPNGLQKLGSLSSDNERFYLPNFRREESLTSEQMEALYEQKLREFLGKGASMSEIKHLSLELIQSWGPATFVEYVELPDGQVRVTEGKAGHLILASGGQVRSAGQIVLLKDLSGKASLLIVSNASGNYKPDIFQVSRLARRIGHSLNLTESQIIVTKGEPVSTQIHKLRLKAAKINPQRAQEELLEMDKTLSKFFSDRRRSLSCSKVQSR